MFGENLDTSNLLSAEAVGILRGLLQEPVIPGRT